MLVILHGQLLSSGIDESVLTVKRKGVLFLLSRYHRWGKKTGKFSWGSLYGTIPHDKLRRSRDHHRSITGSRYLNLRVNYLGWFNEGYYHDAAKDIKVDRELGGKKQLKKLNEKLEALGGTLYGDVAFNRISFEADNYNYKMENSRYYSGYIVSLGRVNPATLRQSGGMGYRETNYNVLSPRYLIRHIDKFTDKINQVEISGISLRDLGDVLPSDKRRSEIINRQEAKQIIVGQFEILDETIDHLMVTGGNAYSFAYARDLINIPSSHNPFYIVDQEVPFYHMVIHGCIDYTSESINLTDSYDKQEIILRMIEFGVAPHFSFSYEESSEIKYTGLNSFYSTQYNIWMEDAVDIYHKTNEVLRNVTNSRMIEHKILDNGIRGSPMKMELLFISIRAMKIWLSMMIAYLPRLWGKGG